MTIHRVTQFLCVFMLAIVCGMASKAHADVTLTVTPLTWNIVGLDSNSPADGPKRFPVGARVCNTGSTDATGVTVDFDWDDANDAYTGDAAINLRSGSLNSIAVGGLAAAACHDAYFEIEVTPNASSFDKTRRYHISAADDATASAVSPQPREIYVEHLISQNRNGIDSINLDGEDIPAGGSMTLMVGNTYTITLNAYTATQGYNQLESFVNFPNTIFRGLDVTTTYTADTSPYVTSPSDMLYADSCLWENDPNSPNYLACVGGDGKAGGTLSVAYTVTIIGGAGTSESLNSLIYDFSGSSFHYNADFDTGFRTVLVTSPATIGIAKAFSPRAIAPGATSTLTFRISNPTAETIADANFVDDFPTGLEVENPANVTYDGCGAGVFLPDPSPADTSLNFTNGTIDPNTVCIITVDVTASLDGTYVNTSDNLMLGAEDTGNAATDTLTVSSSSGCVAGQTLAQWTTSGASAPPDNGSGVPSVNNTGYSASASFSIPANQVMNTTNQRWSAWGFKNSGGYFEFNVDTRSYSNVSMSLDIYPDSNGPTDLQVTYVGQGSGTAATYSEGGGTLTRGVLQSKTIDLSSYASTTGNTVIRIYGTGANNDQSGSNLQLGNILFTGCKSGAPAPTIAKAFATDPIAKGGSSNLTFTINNTASGNQDLTGVNFTDVLPEGLSVSDASSSECGGTVTVTAATRTIALTGGAILSGGSCNFSVAVTGDEEGWYNNVSGYIGSTESGVSTNYAEDNLTVIAPPTLMKSFDQSAVLTGGASTLTFTLSNPNQSDTLTGVAFTDTMPAGVTLASGGPTAVCSGSLTTTAPDQVSFSGGSLGPSSSCDFSISVSGDVTGSKNNTTSVIASNEGGAGDTASATLDVSDPSALIGLNKQISTDNVNWFKFVGAPEGDNVWYRFTISNEGEAALSSVLLTDPDINLSGCSLPSTLAVGESANCTIGPFTVQSGSHTNVATVDATADSATPSAQSNATYAASSLSIVKTVAESSYANTGDVLHYSYLVTNNGSAPLLGPVTLDDDKSSDEACPDLTTIGDFDNYLDPGESLTCNATYTILAGDLTAGSVTNTANATVGGATSNNDDETAPYTGAMTNPAAADDQDLDNVRGSSVTLDVLDNDSAPSGRTLNPASVHIVGATNPGDTLTVPGEGAWTVNTGTGEITFTPELGFSGNPTPIQYTVEDNTGSVSNAATVTVTYVPEADLAITKSSSPDPYVAGSALGYSIVASNAGPDDANGARVQDSFPASLTGVTWTCVGSGGGTCGSASGSGDIDELVDLPSGASVAFTISATVDAGALGTLTNTTTISPPTGVTDPAPGNNSDSDANPTNIQADLSVTKSSSPNPYVAGAALSYSIVASNAGPGDANGTRVRDAFPADLSGVAWTCVGASGGICGSASGSGDIDELVDLPSGGSVTFTVSSTVSLGASATQNNIVTVSPPAGVTDPAPGNNSDSDVNPTQLQADLSVTKTSSPNPYVAGSAFTYTIVAANAGPNDATNARVQDTLPAALSGFTWTCSGSSGGLCGSASGSGDINELVDLPSGSSVTFTVNGTVPTGTTGTLDNTATVSPPTGVTDPTPGNNSDTDSNTPSPPTYDPPYGVKTYDASGLPELVWTMVWYNPNVGYTTPIEITDVLRDNMSYVTGTLLCEARGNSTQTLCAYDAGARTVRFEGTIGPDGPGTLDESSAANEIAISFHVILDNISTEALNQGEARWSPWGNGALSTDIIETGSAAGNTSPTSWPGSSAIPALSGWGALVLGLLLAGASIWRTRRARRA